MSAAASEIIETTVSETDWMPFTNHSNRSALNRAFLCQTSCNTWPAKVGISQEWGSYWRAQALKARCLISYWNWQPFQRLSCNGRDTLRVRLRSLSSRLESNQEDFQSVVPLLTKVVKKAPDKAIWDTAYQLVTKKTPPPRPLPYAKRTPAKSTGKLYSTMEETKYITLNSRTSFIRRFMLMSQVS